MCLLSLPSASSTLFAAALSLVLMVASQSYVQPARTATRVVESQTNTSIKLLLGLSCRLQNPVFLRLQYQGMAFPCHYNVSLWLCLRV